LVTGGQDTSSGVSNAVGRDAGWWELTSGGTTAPSTGTSSTPPAPSGNGYVVDGTTGSRVIAAGSWQSTLTMKSQRATTLSVTVRVFRHDEADHYLPVTTSSSAAVKLGNQWKTIRLPAVSSPTVQLSPGELLYVDVLANVLTAGCCDNAVLHQVDSTGSQLVLPPVSELADPSPTATSTSPSPTATTSPSASPSPTTTPSSSPSATPTAPVTTGPAAPAGIWRPQPGTSWQWQITGTVDTSLPVEMYDIDLFDAQPQATTYDVAGFGRVTVPRGDNAGVIDRLHASGKVVVCYLDTGAWEDYRPDAALFPTTVRGNTTGWSGERWLDIRRAAWPSFEPLIAARLDLARRSGCDGVEPDQNNPWGNQPGFTISLADQKTWYLEVAQLAHDRGLSVGQKNGIETTDADTVAAFDWNLNEECRMYSECQVLDQFVAAGKAVFHVEYVDEGMTVDAFCPQDRLDRFDGLLKRLDLALWRQPCA
jgi:hypothetical protein